MKSKIFFSLFAAASLSLGSPLLAQEGSIGTVDLPKCMSESKLGLQEQENLQSVQSQMIALMENTDKELKEIDGKLNDSDYIDSLSPQAEEELQAQKEQLMRNLDQYRGQFYQMMQQVQYQSYQKILIDVAKASEKVAQDNNLRYILNKEACFYIAPEFDQTSAVISKMNEAFEQETQAADKETAKNEDTSHAVDESSLPQAG